MSTVYVVPLADLVAHDVPGVDLDQFGTHPWLTVQADDQDPDCCCNPAVELVPNDDGPEGWMYVHSSLAGRELRESA